MTSFSAQQVKALRDKTGCGMMECKQALEDASGDMDQAFRLLREKGLAKIEKKQGRQTTEGTVALYIHPTHQRGAMVEVNTETDFAAKNSEFLSFAEAVAQTLVQQQSPGLSQLMEASLSGGSGQSIATSLGDLVGKIGENVTLRRMHLLQSHEDGGTGVVVGYSHLGGKISTLVQFSGVSLEERDEFINGVGRDVAMHIAAAAPLYLSEQDVPADVLAEEQSIIKTTLASEGKPTDKIPMITKGKLAKFYEQVCLIKQKFVKDPKLTISQVLSDKKNNKTIKILAFARFQLGEGLEKKSDDFAEEVARQVSQSNPAP